MTVADIEDQILDLELMATQMYEIGLSGGRTADLELGLERTSGEPFSGFERSEEGVWLLALMCSSCQNPAPVVLTVLSPESEAS
jgi:hypothetical protein